MFAAKFSMGLKAWVLASASISANHGDVFAFGVVTAHDPFGPREVLEQSFLGSSSPNFLFFANVEPGTTTVEAAGVEGVNECNVEFGPDEVAQWPVEAGTVTLVVVDCQRP